MRKPKTNFSFRMLFSKIPAIEQKLKTTSFNGQYQLEAFSFQVPNENLLLNGLTCRPLSGYNSYYYNEKFKKERIVLHHTAGYLKSDIRALSQKNWHVSVAYVIARDGTIYQLHNSDLWSYHLGKGAIGGNALGSRSSVAIELCNYGYLVKKGNNLETIYSRLNGNPVDGYCTLADTDMYIKLDKPFRGQTYFATFTDEQYESLIILLRYLTAKNQIPREFLPEDIRYQTTEKVVDFKGILSHVNYRKSGKWDIGPAFDWDRLMTGVKAATYKIRTPEERAVLLAQTEFELAEQNFIAAQTRLNAARTKLEDAKNKQAVAESQTTTKSVTQGAFILEDDIDIVYPAGKDNKFDETTYGEFGPEKDYNPFDFED